MNASFQQAERDYEARLYDEAGRDDDTVAWSATLDGTDVALVCLVDGNAVCQVVVGDVTLDIELFCQGIRADLQDKADAALRQEQDDADEFMAAMADMEGA